MIYFILNYLFINTFFLFIFMIDRKERQHIKASVDVTSFELLK